MPYFYKDDINYLFIHIPKTGGTSVECYLSDKFMIPLNSQSLFTSENMVYNISNPETIEGKLCHSLQHSTISEITENLNTFKINLVNIIIFTIVRNPYERIISDLFFYDLIKENTPPCDVYSIIINYIKNEYCDNHNIPQYKFIIDSSGNISKSIIILKTENLNNDMKSTMGFEDFNLHIQVNNKLKNKNCYHFLNKDSITIINTTYKKDFELFGYTMI